eukprot:TRINITY_DN19535_c0_g1_i1.p1 TRINITY_DN19535_c0_g1~~TRINITY_DN19535_c0_g1_i1.p1  ORF type:complete len:323 (+),score=54.38 TRINITY_DN19535_c0_g1_i1:55-1023(+)
MEEEGLSSNFKVPSWNICVKAIGLNYISQPNLKKHFVAYPELYSVIQKPRKGDWLDENTEKGQTFINYKKQHSQTMKQKRERTIYVLPLGSFDEEDCAPSLKALVLFVESFFGTTVRLLESVGMDEGEEEVLLSYKCLIHSVTKREEGSKQLLTSDILSFLKLVKRDYTDAFCICAVTMYDLYSEDTNFLFGQANQNLFVGVFSFARYNPKFYNPKAAVEPYDQHLSLYRSCSTVVHEISHLYGLEHCIYYQCIMNGTNTLDEQDRQPIHPCPVCLHKLYVACGFDLHQREHNLKKCYETFPNTFYKDISWISLRLSLLNQN